MGSLSKAIPSQGGFIVCSEVLKNYIVNSAKGFIYSTGLSLVSLFVAEIFFDNLLKFKKQRDMLKKNSLYLAKLLKKNEKNIKTKIQKDAFGMSEFSPIIPVIVGCCSKLDTLESKLKDQDILVGKIKTPTVPKGFERLRISMKASCSKKIIRLIAKICQDFTS
jgi:7-keto-8-aminopelargonate synthetase-like enzyme